MQTSVQALLVVLSCVWFVGYARKGYGALAQQERRTHLLFLLLGAGSFTSVMLGGQKGLGVLLLTAAIAVTALVARLWRPAARPAVLPVPKRVAVAMLLLWLWLFSVDMLMNQLSMDRIGAYLAAALIPVLCWLFALTSSLRNWSVASVCTSYLAFSNFIAALEPTMAWRLCDEFKCNYIGALYKGPFISENFVAILAAFGLVEWLTVDRSERGRKFGLVFCGGMLLASGSRGSLIGVAAAIIWGILAQARGRASGKSVSVPTLLALITASAICAVAYNLIANATYDRFSNRGNVWMQAFSHIREGNLFTGLGLSAWEQLQAAGELPAHFAHSQYLILMFAGGLVSWALFIATFTIALSQPAPPDAIKNATWNGAPVIFLLVTGLVEVFWNPASWDAFSFIIIGALAQTFSRSPQVVQRGARMDSADYGGRLRGPSRPSVALPLASPPRQAYKGRAQTSADGELGQFGPGHSPQA